MTLDPDLLLAELNLLGLINVNRTSVDTATTTVRNGGPSARTATLGFSMLGPDGTLLPQATTDDVHAEPGEAVTVISEERPADVLIAPVEPSPRPAPARGGPRQAPQSVGAAFDGVPAGQPSQSSAAGQRRRTGTDALVW